MPRKPFVANFISRPTMSPSCVFRAYNAPYNAFNGVLNVTRTFAETLQGTLSPSAALYRKSAVEYLLIFQPRIEVLAMPDRYARNALLHAC